MGVVVAVWLLLFLCYGLRVRSRNAPTYLHEPPAGWKPCEVGFLLRWGELDAQDMTAMVMDLVRRRVLRFASPDAGADPPRSLWAAGALDQSLEAVAGHRVGLSAAERYLIEQVLFVGAASGRTSMREFGDRMAADSEGLLTRYLRWKELAESESEKMRVIDPGSVIAQAVAAVLGALMAVPLPLYFMQTTGSYIPAIGIPVGSAMLSQFRALAPTAVDASENWLTAVPHFVYETGSWADSFGAVARLFSRGRPNTRIVKLPKRR